MAIEKTPNGWIVLCDVPGCTTIVCIESEMLTQVMERSGGGSDMKPIIRARAESEHGWFLEAINAKQPSKKVLLRDICPLQAQQYKMLLATQTNKQRKMKEGISNDTD